VSAALFITGTDTGVGKTLVGRVLGAALRARGLRVAPHKPFESGAGRDGRGGLVPGDTLALMAACGLAPSGEDLGVCNNYCFATPVAPALAARLEGVTVDVERVLRAHESLRSRYDVVLIEGAGGLLVPLADQVLVADLAARLGAPLLVVARASLGTINHTLLTVAEARRRGLAVAGVVLSALQPDATPDGPHNAAAIEHLAGVPVLGTLPFVPAAPTAEAATLARLAAHLDLDALLAAAAQGQLVKVAAYGVALR
jgi:dethiobiotin synthetase